MFLAALPHILTCICLLQKVTLEKHGCVSYSAAERFWESEIQIRQTPHGSCMPCSSHCTSLFTWRILSLSPCARGCWGEPGHCALCRPLPKSCSAPCKPNPRECWCARGNPTALQVQFIWNYTRHPSMESTSQSSQGKRALGTGLHQCPLVPTVLLLFPVCFSIVL